MHLTREIPTAPLVLYAVGAVPASLRALRARGGAGPSDSSPWQSESARSRSGSSTAPAASTPGQTTQST
jgi:hypothetical protein